MSSAVSIQTNEVKGGLPALSLSPDILSEGIAVYAIDELTNNVHMIFMSETARNILGLSQETVLPAPLSALGLYADDESRYEMKLKEAFVSRSGFVMVQHLKHPDGNEHFREVRIAPLTSDPNRTLLVEISRDTTITSTSVKELSKYNLRLALCLEQSAQKLWELDLNTHTFSVFDPHQGALGAVSRTYHFPDEFVSKGIVHPDSLASFRLFSRKLLGGEKHGGGAFILKSFNDREQETGAYAWYSVSFRMMFGSDGLPTRAVGILSSLDPISTQPRFIVYGRLWEYLLSSLYAYVQVNLTASQVDKVWLTGKNLTYAVSSMNYQDFMDFSSRRVFSFDSREKVNSLLNRDGLLKLYRDGQTWVTCDIDLVESGAYIRPVTLHVLLTEDDSQDNVYGFFFLQYTDKVIARFGEAWRNAVRLPHSCVFDHLDAKKMIVKYLQTSTVENAHALIRVSNLSPDEKSRAMSYIAASFGLYFETTGLVSLVQHDTLSIFIPDCTSVVKARQMLEDSFLFVRKLLTELPFAAVRFVSVFTQGVLQDYFHDNFLKEGLRSCTRLESRPSDTIEYQPPFTEIKEQRDQSGLFATDLNSLNFSSIQHSLDETERTLLFDAMDLIIRSTNASSTLLRVLSLIGRYYDADRVYAVRLTDGMSTLEELGEWDNAQKASFKGLLTGMSIDKFPLLNRVVNTHKPVFIGRMDRAMNVITTDGSSETWSYAVLPFKSNTSDFFGLLCIDNPFKHSGRLALPEALKPYLVLLNKQILKERYDYISARDIAPGIYGMHAYNEQIGIMNSDIYSSIGVMTLAIPQLLALTNEYGSDHCNNLINYVSELLKRSFGNSFIFHTYDQEFVVVVPNTTKDIFFERVSTVQQLCRRNYPSQISTGATWSRGVFAGEALVKEARTIMLSQQQSGMVPKLNTYEVKSNDFHPLSSSLLKRFTVYFQPKVDMKTNTLVGAEALVRGIDENGAIIPPMRFISTMEKEGTLRDLDLFVLSRVLWQLHDWKKQGYNVVPVSVNFSRFTIFDHSTAGAVLAILSHYDQVAASFIEIELTETACSVEDVTLNRTLEPYRNLGMRFALDDFGTGYANLSIFSKVHFDTVKLDRSLVNDLSVNSVSRLLLESITRISNERKISVVAEGVEYQEQVDILKESGCHIAQGYLYDKPLDVNDFTARYLSKGTQGPAVQVS